jgi:hypothetical protein
MTHCLCTRRCPKVACGTSEMKLVSVKRELLFDKPASSDEQKRMLSSNFKCDRISISQESDLAEKFKLFKGRFVKQPLKA